MQHQWPYLFARLSEIASCSAYGNKLFKMKLSLRTNGFLWLSALESRFSQKRSTTERKLFWKLLFFSEARRGLGFDRLLSTLVFLGKAGFFSSRSLQTSANKIQLPRNRGLLPWVLLCAAGKLTWATQAQFPRTLRARTSSSRCDASCENTRFSGSLCKCYLLTE